jgi:hypothetical protein
MRGRKPKLTPELQRRVVDIVRAGNYLEIAAAACGIHRSTLHRWLERGEQQSHGMYREFYLAVERAQSEAELRDMLLIGKAAATDWRAAAWRLERRAPRRYGTQVQATLREEMNSMLAHLQAVLDPEAFENVMTSLERQDPSGVGNPPPVKDSASAAQARQQLLKRLNRLTAESGANGDSAKLPCGSNTSAEADDGADVDREAK